MPIETPTDAEAFLVFLAEKVKNGAADQAPEELLATWRASRGEAVDDIRRGIEDLEAGRYSSFEEVDAQIRKKFGFADKKA